MRCMSAAATRPRSNGRSHRFAPRPTSGKRSIPDWKTSSFTSWKGIRFTMRLPHEFSLARLWAIVVKEFIQMRRDRLTFAMMVGIPVLQLVLFGLAINADPKHLATAVLLADQGPQGRTLLAAIQNSGYF